MTAYRGGWQGRYRALAQMVLFAIGLAFALMPGAASADDKVQLIATEEQGFARLVLTFPDRLDLPTYRVKYDNGVVAVEFDEPLDVLLPDVAATLPRYIAVARIDPDRRGIRFGLRSAFTLNRMDAGERLFVDLLPPNWQGLPPGLPPEIVAELGERAKQAAIVAEQKRKAEEAKTLHPAATLRVGINPTFVRVQFDWSVDTKAKFATKEGAGVLTFDWPVPVDLYALKAGLPAEIIGATNRVDATGSHVEIKVAKGIVPRFYANTDRQFIVDIDIAKEAGVAAALQLEAAERARQQEAEAARVAAIDTAESPDLAGVGAPSTGPQVVTPNVSMIGNTIRVAFPFERDTAAAVFRRGDTVWMFFDTSAAIQPPTNADVLSPIARGIEVMPAGTTTIVRLDLEQERLATLGSEGRAWVLSLGDVLLNPTEPATLSRHRDEEGRLQMLVDLQRPSQMHEFRDPDVGDVLQVITAFPPARGVARDLRYVDFELLRSVHGLAIKGENDALQVALDGTKAIVTTPDGLTLSALETVRRFDSGNAPEFRSSYIDFTAGKEDDPIQLVKRREGLINRAAQSEGRLRDVARLELAQFYVANQFAYEAIGVLSVLEGDLRADDLRKKTRLTRSIADALAARPADAMAILSSGNFSDEVDALMWRTMVRTDLGDFVGARTDALSSEGVIESYPIWIRSRFLLSGARAAIETQDYPMALRYLDEVEFAHLDPEQVTVYHLLQGRISEGENRVTEALDTYGQVIAADIRPTRAEAVYRTLLLLDRAKRVDLAKATETLSAEIMLWRGNALEADMQKLLAELYFRHKDYRLGFETVKEAVAYYPENRSINALLAQAQDVFSDLYLNGRADELEPIDALSLYYDFRHLTPPGNRGDEMIRNLARRLVKVDLLTQAADLLEYQIDSRLKGVAQAQIAADLAVIRIAARDPEAALRILNRTRLADLSPQLERQRRILEARALIDAGRQEIAIDLLSRVTGKDADLLRVDGYWKSKNYTAASELLEMMLSPGQNSAPLETNQRMNVIKAAVGFALAGDKLALSRVRSKFSGQMAQTPEWAMFDFVTGDVTPTSIEFRKVAREISGLDSLNAFLESYRQVYATGDQVAPARAAAPAAA